MDADYDKAMAYALRLLSIQMRTEQELDRRLSKKGYGQPVTDQVLARLKELGYLDDTEYVATYIRSRLKPTGRRRLKYELLQKGIAKETVELGLAVNYSEDQEMAAALQLTEKLWSQTTNLPFKDIGNPQEITAKRVQKVAARLIARGFAYSIVTKVITKMASEFTESMDI